MFPMISVDKNTFDLVRFFNFKFYYYSIFLNKSIIVLSSEFNLKLYHFKNLNISNFLK